jgi:hypothetical protein
MGRLVFRELIREAIAPVRVKREPVEFALHFPGRYAAVVSHHGDSVLADRHAGHPGWNVIRRLRLDKSGQRGYPVAHQGRFVISDVIDSCAFLKSCKSCGRCIFDMKKGPYTCAPGHDR